MSRPRRYRAQKPSNIELLKLELQQNAQYNAHYLQHEAFNKFRLGSQKFQAQQDLELRRIQSELGRQSVVNKNNLSTFKPEEIAYKKNNSTSREYSPPLFLEFLNNNIDKVAKNNNVDLNQILLQNRNPINPLYPVLTDKLPNKLFNPTINRFHTNINISHTYNRKKRSLSSSRSKSKSRSRSRNRRKRKNKRNRSRSKDSRHSNASNSRSQSESQSQSESESSSRSRTGSSQSSKKLKKKKSLSKSNSRSRSYSSKSRSNSRSKSNSKSSQSSIEIIESKSRIINDKYKKTKKSKKVLKTLLTLEDRWSTSTRQQTYHELY